MKIGRSIRKQLALLLAAVFLLALLPGSFGVIWGTGLPLNEPGVIDEPPDGGGEPEGVEPAGKEAAPDEEPVEGDTYIPNGTVMEDGRVYLWYNIYSLEMYLGSANDETRRFDASAFARDMFETVEARDAFVAQYSNYYVLDLVYSKKNDSAWFDSYGSHWPECAEYMTQSEIENFTANSSIAFVLADPERGIDSLKIILLSRQGEQFDVTIVKDDPDTSITADITQLSEIVTVPSEVPSAPAYSTPSEDQTDTGGDAVTGGDPTVGDTAGEPADAGEPIGEDPVDSDEPIDTNDPVGAEDPAEDGSSAEAGDPAEAGEPDAVNPEEGGADTGESRPSSQSPARTAPVQRSSGTLRYDETMTGVDISESVTVGGGLTVLDISFVWPEPETAAARVTPAGVEEFGGIMPLSAPINPGHAGTPVTDGIAYLPASFYDYERMQFWTSWGDVYPTLNLASLPAPYNENAATGRADYLFSQMYNTFNHGLYSGAATYTFPNTYTTVTTPPPEATGSYSTNRFYFGQFSAGNGAWNNGFNLAAPGGATVGSHNKGHALGIAAKTLTQNDNGKYRFAFDNTYGTELWYNGTASAANARYLYPAPDKDIPYEEPDANGSDSSILSCYYNLQMPFYYDSATGYYSFDSDTEHSHLYSNTISADGGMMKMYEGKQAVNRETPTWQMHEFWGGGWYPFSNFDDTDNSTDYTNVQARNNFWGMRMDLEFMMPKDGQINGQNMEFNFRGDDDIWVYIDGKLALDIGGMHTPIYGSINFATGQSGIWSSEVGGSGLGRITSATQVTGYGQVGSKAQPYFTWKLYDDDADDTTTEGLIGGTGISKAPYTKHTMTIFYMERGGGDSNCMMGFNLPILPPSSISLEKESSDDSYSVSDIFDFDVFTTIVDPAAINDYTEEQLKDDSDDVNKWELQEDGSKTRDINGVPVTWTTHSATVGQSPVTLMQINEDTWARVFENNPASHTAYQYRVIDENAAENIYIEETMGADSGWQKYEFVIDAPHNYLITCDNCTNIAVIKTDADDDLILLPGAEFELYKDNLECDVSLHGVADAGDTRVPDVSTTYTTNADGTFEIPYSVLEANAIYYLREVTPPQDYSALTDEIWFETDGNRKIVDIGSGMTKIPGGTGMPARTERLYLSNGQYNQDVSEDKPTRDQATFAVSSVTSSSTTGNDVTNTGHSSVGVVDGQKVGGYRWESLTVAPQGTESPNQWIQIDFDQAYNLNGIDIFWESAYASAYTVQVRVGGVWQTVATETNFNAGDGDQLREYIFTERQADAIRVNMTTRRTGNTWGYSIWEIEPHIYIPAKASTEDAYNVTGSLSYATKTDNRTITVTNTRQTEDITIIKVDGTNASTFLAGAVFDLYRHVPGGSPVFIATLDPTDSNGEVTIDGSYLSPDEIYFLREVTAPGGYVQLTEVIYFKIASDCTVESVGGINVVIPAGAHGGINGQLYLSASQKTAADTAAGIISGPVLSPAPSATASTIDAGNVAGNILQSNTNTWGSSYAGTDVNWPDKYDQWIYVDLGAVYEISKIDIEWRSAGGFNMFAYDYEVRYADNSINPPPTNDVAALNTAWTSVGPTGVVTGNTAFANSISFAPVNARYVLVRCTARVNLTVPYGYAMVEMKVYEPIVPASDSIDTAVDVSAEKTNDTEITVSNEPTEDVVIIKKDGDNKSLLLPGAVFELYKYVGGVATLVTELDPTDSFGRVVIGYDDLEPDTVYILREITAPDKYEQITEDIYFSTDSDRKVADVWVGEVEIVTNTDLVKYLRDKDPLFTTWGATALNYGGTHAGGANSGDATYAIDGIDAHVWEATYDVATWIKVDLGDSYLLSSVSFDYSQYGANTITVSVSDDDVYWEELGTVNRTTAGRQVLAFDFSEVVSARYVRLNMPAHLNWATAIYNIEIKGRDLRDSAEDVVELTSGTNITVYNTQNLGSIIVEKTINELYKASHGDAAFLFLVEKYEFDPTTVTVDNPVLATYIKEITFSEAGTADKTFDNLERGYYYKVSELENLVYDNVTDSSNASSGTDIVFDLTELYYTVELNSSEPYTVEFYNDFVDTPYLTGSSVVINHFDVSGVVSVKEEYQYIKIELYGRKFTPWIWGAGDYLSNPNPATSTAWGRTVFALRQIEIYAEGNATPVSAGINAGLFVSSTNAPHDGYTPDKSRLTDGDLTYPHNSSNSWESKATTAANNGRDYYYSGDPANPGNADDPEWIWIDLGAQYNISEVVLYWRYFFAEDIIIYGATDAPNQTSGAGNWTEIGRGHNDPAITDPTVPGFDDQEPPDTFIIIS